MIYLKIISYDRYKERKIQYDEIFTRKLSKSQVII
jgi:hypothetical protein